MKIPLAFLCAHHNRNISKGKGKGKGSGFEILMLDQSHFITP
jgi:hypothetical protein